MTRLPIMFCSFSVLLSLFAGVSAEETISISVNPGWMTWKGYDCEYVTDENGTWEECQYYEEYEKHLIEVMGPSSTDWKIEAPLGADITFTYEAGNLENGTEYLFSYELILVRYNNAVTNASHQFIANNTEEYVYNLTGQLISEYEYPYTLDNCSGLMASVSFVKNPNAENGTGEELAKFSTYFSPSGRSMDPLCQISYNGYNSGGGLLNIFGLCLSPILFLFTVSKMFSLFFQPSDTEVADNTSRIDVVTNSNTRALFWLIMMFVSVIMFFMSMIVMW